MKLPKKILELIEVDSLVQNNIGQSKTRVFRLTLKNGCNGFLKIGNSYYAKEEAKQEIRVLNWLNSKLYTPKKLAFIDEGDLFYFLMSEVAGENLAEIGNEIGAKRCLILAARYLNKIHSIDISQCSFNRSLGNTLKMAENNLTKRLVDESDFDNIRAGKSGETLFLELKNKIPNSEDLVFTHGDYCFPNVIFLNDEISGIVDLGNAGVADRYQDIALFLRSFESNMAKPDIKLFLQEYGLIKQLDSKKVEFYQMLDEFF